MNPDESHNRRLARSAAASARDMARRQPGTATALAIEALADAIDLLADECESLSIAANDRVRE